MLFSRLGVYIPLPGVDVAAFADSVKTEGLLGYIDTLSGGSISRVGIFSLGELLVFDTERRAMPVIVFSLFRRMSSVLWASAAQNWTWKWTCTLHQLLAAHDAPAWWLRGG